MVVIVEFSPSNEPKDVFDSRFDEDKSIAEESLTVCWKDESTEEMCFILVVASWMDGEVDPECWTVTVSVVSPGSKDNTVSLTSEVFDK